MSERMVSSSFDWEPNAGGRERPGELFWGSHMEPAMDEKEISPVAVLTSMFEQLPEDLQQVVIEMVADLHHLACEEKRLEKQGERGSQGETPRQAAGHRTPRD
jgi:hypothetical protein